jgi:5-methylcytosine-specific restriction endonuclease McrA
MAKVRKCTKCLKVKQLDRFAKNSRNKTDGRQPKCKECNKNYYIANQENIKKRIKEWYYDNHKDRLVRRRELAASSEAKEKRAQQDKAYYLNNKDSEWVKLNRIRLVEYWKSLYYIKSKIKQNGNNTLTLEQVLKLYDKHPYCEYCKQVETKLTIDHVVPTSVGGQNCITNVTIACEYCNFSKGNKLLEEWLSAHESLRHKES